MSRSILLSLFACCTLSSASVFATANSSEISGPVSVTYTSTVKSHVEQFSRQAVYNPNAKTLSGSAYFTRQSAPIKAETRISGSGGLLDDPSFSWLKSADFKDASPAGPYRGRVQIRFQDPTGGNSPGYLTMTRRSNFDSSTGEISKDGFQDVWQAQLQPLPQDDISKQNGEKSFTLYVSQAMREGFGRDAAIFMTQSLKPQIEAACNNLCVAKLVSTNVKGLDNSQVKVSVYKDSANPFTPTAMLYWPQYTVSFKVEIRPKTAEDLVKEYQGQEI